MLGPRGVTFLLAGVVLVVAGQVELAEVQDRVPAVEFKLGVGDPFLLLGSGQVSLVVRVREPRAAGPRRHQAGKPGPDACRGQVLWLAVILVPACVFAYLGDVEIADSAHPRGEVHAADVTRGRGRILWCGWVP